ncbi:unnamed protein product [Brassica rapa]|uniref:Uncharacterized protein n=1 Tax=Brassica campestris TaxID=3711 RepID=A0A8D9G8R7_BRACM|nr:unnamed protein product [Brassica rapa]
MEVRLLKSRLLRPHGSNLPYASLPFVQGSLNVFGWRLLRKGHRKEEDSISHVSIVYRTGPDPFFGLLCLHPLKGLSV